jgi:hypothetical protein
MGVAVSFSCWLAFAASASAAAPVFAAPVDLSTSGHDARFAQVAFDASGNALAVWQGFDGTSFVAQSAFRPAGGAFAAPLDLSATGHNAADPQVAFDGSGNALAVWDRSNGTSSIVQGAFRPATGTFAAPVDISVAGVAGRDAFDPQVAFDATGNALAVWERSNGTNQIVQAAFRPAGGAFAAPVDLSASGLGGEDARFPQVAFDASGNALVVWERSNGTNEVVQSAFRPAGGAFAASVDLSTSGQNASDPQVAFDASGNALAVWEHPAGTGDLVQAAFRPAGGPFAAPVDVSTSGQNAADPQVAFDASGNALAVWDRSNGTNLIAQAAFRPAGDAFAAPVDLSAGGQDALAPQVAFDPSGNALAVWHRSNGTNLIVQAASGISSTRTLSVSVAGSGSGAVTSQPAGISCGVTCSAAYATGTPVTLTAATGAGSTFGGWSGACSGSATCTVSMTQARAVTATFTAQPNQLGGLPQPPASPPATAVAVGCVANRLILTDVFPRSGKVRLLGVAPPSAAGKRVTVFSTWNGKQVAKPTVHADLTFSAAVPLPPRRLRFTNKARYVAKLGSQRSLALKFARRMHATAVTAAGRHVTFSGTITPPLAKPIQPVVIRASASCSTIGRGAIVASVKPSRHGAFTAHFDLAAGQSVAYLRAQTKVRNRKRTFSTYTLIRGVKLG